MTRGFRRISAAAALCAAALALAGCTGAPPSTQGSDPLVLASPQPLGQYNPIDGYGMQGVSPLYEGLLRPESNGTDALPDLVPALATKAPQSNPEATVWDVELRQDVTFSDGSTLDAQDVVATYEAVLDPDSASAISSWYSMIDSIEAVDAHHVRFELDYSYSAFPALLLLGIAPSEAITDQPAVDSPLNTQPIGTGPYELTELTSTEAVFTAREDYWGPQPQLERFVTTYVPDDNARAQRMRAGDIDGTVLPPRLAEAFQTTDGVAVRSVPAADWRSVSLPKTNPFTGDERARLAMNLAVDRQAMVEGVLLGHGRPASTPVAPMYGEGYNPDATFEFDRDRAEQMLTDAGWVPGDDGVRVKDGDRAEFTLLYPASDSLRRDLSTAFATQMGKVGIDVSVEGASWKEIEQRLDDVAVLLAGGQLPYDLDPQIYDIMHSRSERTSAFDNPAGLTIPGVDDELDQARRSLDPQQRAEHYRRAQAAYAEQPSHVFLVFLNHTYVARDNGWDRGPAIVEPHAHSIIWGPWWNLARWQK